MAIVLSGTTNDITINGVSVATDAEVSSAVAPLATSASVEFKSKYCRFKRDWCWSNITNFHSRYSKSRWK